MKKYELYINMKEVCDYAGGKESPLEDSISNVWSVGVNITHAFECETLTAQIIASELKEAIYNDVDINTDELFATESYLQYSRIEDDESYHLSGVVDYNAYYATYIIHLKEIIDTTDLTKIDGITEY